MCSSSPRMGEHIIGGLVALAGMAWIETHSARPSSAQVGAQSGERVATWTISCSRD